MHTAVRLVGSLAAWGLSLAILAGCYTPATRAGERPHAWRQLPPDDRVAALDGQVRNGFSRDAVYIAWGVPSRVETVRLPHRSYEEWFYTHTEVGEGGVYFGVAEGFAYPAGRGDDGHNFRAGYYGSRTDFYRAAPYIHGFGPPQTEVLERKAVFANGQVISHAPR